MRELIEQIPHYKPTEDHDREHSRWTCLRCQMEVEWKRIEDSLAEVNKHFVQ